MTASRALLAFVVALAGCASGRSMSDPRAQSQIESPIELDHLDGGERALTRDLRPTLPLILRY